MPRNARPKDDSYDLDNSIGYLLNRAANIIAARFSDELKPHEINLQMWRMLATLSACDDQSVSELADHTGAELSYLSRSVAALQERGLVERKQSPSDRRANLVSLTPAGRTLVRTLAPRGRATEKASLAGVPAADLEATLRTLRLVCRNLVQGQADATSVNRKLTVARRVKKRVSALPDQPTRQPTRPTPPPPGDTR